MMFLSLGYNRLAAIALIAGLYHTNESRHLQMSVVPGAAFGSSRRAYAQHGRDGRASFRVCPDRVLLPGGGDRHLRLAAAQRLRERVVSPIGAAGRSERTTDLTRVLFPVAGALLALTAGAGRDVLRQGFRPISFLALPRSEKAANAHEPMVSW